MSKKLNYVGGYTIANSRKLLNWVFPTEFYDIKKNEKEFVFEVYLKKPTNEVELDELNEIIIDFLEYWGCQYKFYYVNSEL